jgi:prevent-host-death family protein
MTRKVRRVGIHEAKTHLSRLLREVDSGADVIIERGGVPVARIVPAGDRIVPSESYGLFSGQFRMADDFDRDSDELADLFGIPR